jgi:hypothetical protein
MMARRKSDATSLGDWIAADPDRAAARWLPDEYVALRGMPSIRIMELIDRAWSHFPDGDRRQVAQALLGILAPVHLGEPVTPEMRSLCERTVLQWRERIKVRTYQGGGEEL